MSCDSARYGNRVQNRLREYFRDLPSPGTFLSTGVVAGAASPLELPLGTESYRRRWRTSASCRSSPLELSDISQTVSTFSGLLSRNIEALADPHLKTPGLLLWLGRFSAFQANHRLDFAHESPTNARDATDFALMSRSRSCLKEQMKASVE